MNNIVIGQYIPGNSYLYKLDPRAKIISLVILMIATFILTSLQQIIFAFLIILLVLLTGRISVLRVLKGLRPLMVLLVMTTFFQIFLNKTGDVVFSESFTLSYLNMGIIFLLFLLWRLLRRYVKFPIFLFLLFVISIFVVQYYNTSYPLKVYSITVYQGGIEMSFFVMIRLIIIITLSTILTLTTMPTDLNLGLEKLMKPLKILHIDAEEISMIISIALRYIPTLFDEANKIMAAQASRGVDFTEGRLKDKITQVISLLIPMFIISFKRSDDLAYAMEARCFQPGSRRTRIVTLKWKIQDTITCFVSTIFFVLAIVL